MDSKTVLTLDNAKGCLQAPVWHDVRAVVIPKGYAEGAELGMLVGIDVGLDEGAQEGADEGMPLGA